MNLDAHYLVWQPVSVKGAYAVLRFDDALLKRTEGTLSENWPAEAFCVVDTERGTEEPVLLDFLSNRDRRLIVSGRLKLFLEKKALPEVEYLPVRIIDRIGKRLDDAYFVVRLLNGPDSLDLDASGATRSRILPSKADKVQRLVFKSDPARALFSPGNFNKVSLVSWELAQALAEEGFSGFRFMGLFDYGLHGDLPPHSQRFTVDAVCARLWTNSRKHLPAGAGGPGSVRNRSRTTESLDF